jgi:hypothetical protein
MPLRSTQEQSPARDCASRQKSVFGSPGVWGFRYGTGVYAWYGQKCEFRICAGGAWRHGETITFGKIARETVTDRLRGIPKTGSRPANQMNISSSWWEWREEGLCRPSNTSRALRIPRTIACASFTGASTAYCTALMVSSIFWAVVSRMS